MQPGAALVPAAAPIQWMPAAVARPNDSVGLTVAICSAILIAIIAIAVTVILLVASNDSARPNTLTQPPATTATALVRSASVA